MKKYNIAVVPLDGVNKHVIPLAVDAVKKAQMMVGGLDLEFQFYDAGFEYWLKTGKRAPDGFKIAMEAADAMFCGSHGQFSLDDHPVNYPEYRAGGVFSGFFRGGMGNTIGLRPLVLLPGVECPIKGKEKVDVMLLRQISEGGYHTPGKTISNDAAYDITIVTRKPTEALAHHAFRLAKNRNGRLRDGRKMVTLGVKRGGLACQDFYWDIFNEVHEQYQDIELSYTQIDALAEHIIKDPDRFDVVVCENAHGDIISDIGSFLTGGMGITPTADIGGITPHFRPNHGTFPRAVGKNIANPIAAFLTGALMLEVLGNDHDDDALRCASRLIKQAVADYLTGGGPRTRDMGGKASTEQAATAIMDALGNIRV
ncbi:MAG: isocitrate/isopropylmalate dehydrogenase family protein [Firmicutes bacterium]|nr:isocitrate/isopropylmalate dehydrogenase family protein [Bacillota bacterium]